jgi:urease accessory protein
MTFVSERRDGYRRQHSALTTLEIIMTSSSQRLRWLVACSVAALVPLTVQAHPADQAAHDAMAGFLHPFTGLDHVLAMIAVGLWAARMGRTAALSLPLIFPLMMMAGAALAGAHIALPAIEPMIALSVIVFGVLIAVGVRLPLFASAFVVGVFAIFHGHAHVIEASASAVEPYIAGFVGATVILHLIGLGVGWASRGQSVRFAQWAGSAIAVAGAALMFAA